VAGERGLDLERALSQYCFPRSERRIQTALRLHQRRQNARYLHDTSGLRQVLVQRSHQQLVATPSAERLLQRDRFALGLEPRFER